MKPETRPLVKSADRVFDIFELFTGEQDHFSLSEISKTLNMPASSTHQIIQNMLARGYLEEDPDLKRFRIGYKLFDIQSRYSRNTSMTKQFYEVAERIHSVVNETISLAIRKGKQVLYIAEKMSTQPLRYTRSIGGIVPLHATASGKLFVAYESAEQIEMYLKSEQLIKITDETITDSSTLLNQLEQIKIDGIAYNYGESVAGVQCIATPILNREGAVVAAISISIPEVRITDEVWSEVHVQLRKASQAMMSIA